MKSMWIAWLVALAACVSGAQHVYTAAPAYAPDATLGSAMAAIEGIVVDKDSKDPIAGATILIGPSSGSDQSVITDEHGKFRIVMAPGRFELAVYWNDFVYKRAGVELRAGGILRIAVDFDVQGATAAEREEHIL